MCLNQTPVSPIQIVGRWHSVIQWKLNNNLPVSSSSSSVEQQFHLLSRLLFGERSRSWPPRPPLGFSSKNPVMGLYHRRLTFHILSINRFHWLFFRLIISDQHPVFFPSGHISKTYRTFDCWRLECSEHLMSYFTRVYCFFKTLFLKKSRYCILCAGWFEGHNYGTTIDFYVFIQESVEEILGGCKILDNGPQCDVSAASLHRKKAFQKLFFPCCARQVFSNQMRELLLFSRYLDIKEEKKCIYINMTCIWLTVFCSPKTVMRADISAQLLVWIKKRECGKLQTFLDLCSTHANEFTVVGPTHFSMPFYCLFWAHKNYYPRSQEKEPKINKWNKNECTHQWGFFSL